jgi:hypothetical protein
MPRPRSSDTLDNRGRARRTRERRAQELQALRRAVLAFAPYVPHDYRWKHEVVIQQARKALAEQPEN